MTSQDWKNKDNWSFYDKIPHGILGERYGRPMGLSGAPELDLIGDYLEGALSVLEFGAGEGRVIDGLLQRSYSGQIYALERQPSFLEQLHKMYKDKNHVTIVEGDILQSKNIPKADIGLWLWAGIMEFSPQEQNGVLRNLEKFIDKTLIVETPEFGSKTNATRGEERWLEIQGEHGIILHGYLPSEMELHSYIADTQWHMRESIRYEIVRTKKRVLYVLQKRS